jgi:hypothetical protein
MPNPQWQFDQSNVSRLLGAHGEEIIRSLYLDEQVGSHMVNLSICKTRNLQRCSGGQFSPAVKTALYGPGSLTMLVLGRTTCREQHIKKKQLPAIQSCHKRRRTGRSPRTRNGLGRIILNKYIVVYYEVNRQTPLVNTFSGVRSIYACLHKDLCLSI